MSDESGDQSSPLKSKEETANGDESMEVDSSRQDSSPSKDVKDDDEKPAEDTKSESDDDDDDQNNLDENKEEDNDDKDNSKNEDDMDDDEDDDEPQVGLLEQPLVLEEGRKRERKKVENFAATQTMPTKSPKARLEIAPGKGMSLGDIPFIEYMIGRTKAENLKLLHRIMFRRPCKNNEVKKNIRQFSGFPFPKSDPEYQKRLDFFTGITIAQLKKMMEVLDLARGGTKKELVDRMMEWLELPKDSKRKIPQKKKKKASGGDGGKKKRKRSSSTSKKSAEKGKKKSAESVSDVSDSESEPEPDNSDDEEEEKEPPKKKAKTETPKAAETPKAKKETPKKKKKAAPKADSDEDEDSEEEKKPKKKAKTTPKAKKEKESPKKKKTPTPKKKAKDSDAEVSDISSDMDSDDEPLVQKKANPAPTNDDLKKVVKKMLDSANLEQVTMKTVLKDVFAKYPEHDLSDRKEFIKNTVKQIIS